MGCNSHRRRNKYHGHDSPHSSPNRPSHLQQTKDWYRRHLLPPAKSSLNEETQGTALASNTLNEAQSLERTPHMSREERISVYMMLILKVCIIQSRVVIEVTKHFLRMWKRFMRSRKRRRCGSLPMSKEVERVKKVLKVSIITKVPQRF
jgi:hypothetical protein